MCCFSRPVKSVTGTNIFARSSSEGRQLLAYQATLEASEALAMVLPLPTPPGVAEVMVPGEPEARSERERRAGGIPVEDETWRQIEEIAAELKVG